MCNRIFIVAAAKAVVRVVGKGTGESPLAEAHRSIPTGLPGRRHSKTSPTLHTSTSFRSLTSAKQRCGTKRATALKYTRGHVTDVCRRRTRRSDSSSRRSP